MMFILWPAILIVSLNIENLSNKLGLSFILTEYIEDKRVISVLEFFLNPWVQIPTILILGGSLAIWIDRLLRRAEERKPPIFHDPRKYSYDPRSEVSDASSYDELVGFTLNYVLPACVSQIELQKSILRDLSATDKLAQYAIEGLEKDYSLDFWTYYNTLESGLYGSDLTIRFEELMNCIKGLEKNSYREFCLQGESLMISGCADHTIRNSVKNKWQDWRAKHDKLVAEYNKFKSDPRYRLLWRPGKLSRWGPAVSPISLDERQRSE